MAVDRVGIAQADALAGHLSSLPGLPIYETSLPRAEEAVTKLDYYRNVR